MFLREERFSTTIGRENQPRSRAIAGEIVTNRLAMEKF